MLAEKVAQGITVRHTNPSNYLLCAAAGRGAHAARVGHAELGDPGQRPQALAQVRLVRGRHDRRHACQAVYGARAQQPLGLHITCTHFITEVFGN